MFGPSALTKKPSQRSVMFKYRILRFFQISVRNVVTREGLTRGLPFSLATSHSVRNQEWPPPARVDQATCSNSTYTSTNGHPLVMPWDHVVTQRERESGRRSLWITK